MTLILYRQAGMVFSLEVAKRLIFAKEKHWVYSGFAAWMNLEMQMGAGAKA